MLVGVLLLSASFTFNGCADSSAAAPVIAIAPKSAVTKGIHTVKSGESLYLIAWRYGRDFKELAVANGIDEPFNIHPGQKISLRLASTKQLERYAQKKQKSRTVVKEVKAVSLKEHKPSSSRLTPKDPIIVNKSSTWLWPAKGQVISRFQQKPKPNKGIDIASHKGSSVTATKAGKVVYSGQGLRGYGRLLIIKHDDDYLSAYAHNDEILVKEGHYVKQGQTIAKMGESDSDQVKLHFEIRKNGQPVDPLRYLPKIHS